MQSTPRSNRLAIAFFGRRNVGKSSLVNALTGQEVSLVSPIPGATADPVSKSMELLPIGPITVIDTAGLDDEGELGQEKVRRAKEILGRSDLAVLVCDASTDDKELEIQWIKNMSHRGERFLVVENKIDLIKEVDEKWMPVNAPKVRVSVKTGEGLDLFIDALVALAAQSPAEASLVASMFPAKSLFMLVAPQDIQAPKGRLILPQVQIMRDILDHGSLISLSTLNIIEKQIKSLTQPPDLVIADSQIFGQVIKIIPAKWLITTFSIIMARAKGDLGIMLEGAKAIDRLKPGANVLIAEACTHHALSNDIARDQLPRKLKEKAGGELKITVVAGNDFPHDLSPYNLIINCGGCMITRGHYISRLKKALEAQIPITNFGLSLAYLNGGLDRATAIFH